MWITALRIVLRILLDVFRGHRGAPFKPNTTAKTTAEFAAEADFAPGRSFGEAQDKQGSDCAIALIAVHWTLVDFPCVPRLAKTGGLLQW